MNHFGNHADFALLWKNIGVFRNTTMNIKGMTNYHGYHWSYRFAFSIKIIPRKYHLMWKKSFTVGPRIVRNSIQKSNYASLSKSPLSKSRIQKTCVLLNINMTWKVHFGKFFALSKTALFKAALNKDQL